MYFQGINECISIHVCKQKLTKLFKFYFCSFVAIFILDDDQDTQKVSSTYQVQMYVYYIILYYILYQTTQ